MKTIYDKQIEKIEDIYAKSLLTAKALKRDMDRLECAVPVVLRHFASCSVSCLIHTHYDDAKTYPSRLALHVNGGSDDDLLKLLLDLPPVLIPEVTGDVVVKVENGNEYYNEISIAARLGNKFSVSLRADEFPRDWLMATVDRYLQITGQKPRVIGVDLAKPEETEVAA